MKKAPKEIKQIYHYSKDDEECSGDYWACQLLFDGKIVLDLGDYYHDKSDNQIDGFLAACEYIWGKLPKTIVESVADME